MRDYDYMNCYAANQAHTLMGLLPGSSNLLKENFLKNLVDKIHFWSILCARFFEENMNIQFCMEAITEIQAVCLCCTVLVSCGTLTLPGPTW